MIYILIFIFGAIFGSFLNVLVYRLKNGGDIVFGRSMCPHCKTVLKWFDLIPFFSFIFLLGKCRSCRKKISWQYPIVEFLNGLIWIGVFWKISEGGIFSILSYVYYVFIFSSLLAIAVYDFKWKIIPDKVLFPSIAIALIFDGFSPSRWGVALAVFLFFYLIYFFSHGRAIGFGDAKLGFLLGLILTSAQTYLAFNLAFITGGLFGIILLVLGKKSLKSQIAFGPFLVVGAFLAFLFDFLVKNWLPF
jgi:prepilin signal peptidase PulO-like enzyme (type II secretory pathway)